MKRLNQAGALARAVLILLLCGQLAAFSQQPAAQPTPATPVEVKINPNIFDAYVGQYRDNNDSSFVFSFFRDGDKFYIQATDQPKFEMFPASESRFFVKDLDAQVDFIRDANGKVSSIIWHQRGKDFPAPKISDQPAKSTFVSFTRKEEMIAMRDGVKLYTVILAPENQSEPLPILMDRTPYGVKNYNSNAVNFSAHELIKDGYIFVYQDIRGRNDSEGEFLMNRPPRDKRNARATDESTDTYDTIDWLVKNVPKNNGRVGIRGVSYDGWLASVSLIDPHPALRAASPQAPMTDTWMGDDFFHNGAFRQTYGHEYVKEMETNKTETDVSFEKDAFDWYLEHKTLANLTAELSGKLPTWNSFVEHPAYDAYWQARAAERYLPTATVPTLVVGGFWDQEDMFGAFATYQALEKSDRQNKVFFVMGPWNHGGWGRGAGRKLGAIDFESDTGKYFREQIQAPWFACYLKDKCTVKQPEAMIFESGSNHWMSYDAWPPRANVEPRNLYFQANGKLSFDKPQSAKSGDEFDSYVSDPANPVPYRKRPIEATYDRRGSGWRPWLVSDQRFLSDRKDVLKWQTDVLTDDVTVTGDVIAHLFAATTGTDADWVVKLIDVYPENNPEDSKMAAYQLMVAEEIMRGRYYKSFEKPQAIEPNKVNEYTVDLRGNDYTFKKGHRMMVQVQSSWYPLYDRNPQKFVENIFLAKETDFQMATERIYHSPKEPSHLSVSVATR